LVLGIATLLMSGVTSRGQESSSPARTDRIDTYGPIDVLSETRGFDMGPYMKNIIARVRTTWFSLVPTSARWPIKDRGHVSIDFRVMKDGHVEDVKYHETSGNEGMDRAAYGAITGFGPMPSFPEEFQCEFVRMRFHFYYNQRPANIKERVMRDHALSCVTSTAASKVATVEKLPLLVSPNSIQMAPGAKTRFYAKIYGIVDSAITWSIRGSGCEGSACGSISSDGLYTAPDKVPNPAAITVIATSTVTPTLSASSTVTIAAASDSH
jgi:TonB family protein